MQKASFWKMGVVALLLVSAVIVIQIKASENDPSRAARQEPAPAAYSAGQPRLLELGADSCVPCKMMQPILADLRKEHPGKLQVEFIDVWKDPEAGKRYGIEAIPTQVFFDEKGREIFRHTGFYAKDDILAKFRENGISL